MGVEEADHLAVQGFVKCGPIEAGVGVQIIGALAARSAKKGRGGDTVKLAIGLASRGGRALSGFLSPHGYQAKVGG